ncbi:MAG: hypothetical protein IT204_24435 [Fimbriimonadaceae bacterium]|nr:hypothetical protein [Fimbriimonadaceae bacterium]
MRRREWLALALLGRPAAACLWDRDTLAAEAAGLPGVWEAISGLYPRHTREYYQQRRDTVGAEPTTPTAFDDLAVAVERLGDPRRAASLMVEKERRWPGQYTTWANYGTFLAHAGRLDEAAVALERALAINPQAHFGRERYQLLAVRYFLDAQRHPAVLTSRCCLGFEFSERLGEAFRLSAPRELDDRTRPTQQRHVLERLNLQPDVYDGLIGMMVIAQQDPPEFYYVLGELLAARGDRRMAWHAYQRAYDLEHPRSADLPLYQDEVRRALDRRQQDELTKPRHWAWRRRVLAWVDAYQTWERELLRSGGDPNDPARRAEFDEAHPKP